MLLRRRPEIKIKFLLSCGARKIKGLRGAENDDTSSWAPDCLCQLFLYFTPRLRLEDHFDRKLNFPRGRSRSRQQTRHSSWCSVREKDVRVVGSRGRREVGVVHNVEDLGAELHVEVLRDTLDVVVLEHREVQIRDAWADQDVPACIASKIETLQVGSIAASTIICSPKGSVGSSGDGEALRLDVVVGVARIS